MPVGQKRALEVGLVRIRQVFQDVPHRLEEVGHLLDQVLDRAAQAVEPPDHQLVAGARIRQGRGQSRPFAAGTRARYLVGMDVIGVAARGQQGVALQVQRLFVGRDARVADLPVRGFPDVELRPPSPVTSRRTA